MPALIDHSPRQTSAAAPLPSASNVILIDNYDSFTWNVYQYLVLEGATVTVHRNDKITLDELIAQRPTQLVVSPGPGHPETDSGVSRAAVQHFAGKIPILGVCMGQSVSSLSPNRNSTNNSLGNVSFRSTEVELILLAKFFTERHLSFNTIRKAPMPVLTKTCQLRDITL